MGRSKQNSNKPRKSGKPTASGGKGRDSAGARARDALRESEARFRATFEQAAVGVAHTTTEGRFLQANGKLCQMLGYTGAELRALTTRELTHNDDRDKHDALRLELLAGRRTSYAIEKRFLRRNGSVIWVNRTVMLARRPSTNEPYLIQVIEDISERKATEARLQRLMRARRVMAECTHVLIHAANETRMLEDMCRIVVESGGYRMAWVGFPTAHAGGGIRAIAHAGFGDDAPMSGPVAWSADGRYQGFMSEVITTGKPHIARNILDDPAHERRRARALQHSFQSSIALPLRGEGEIIGAAAIYAREADAFDTDEIALLSELVADVAYGIVNLRTRIAREQAEKRSRESEQRFRETFEQAAVGITRVDLNGVLVDMNQKFCDMLGYGKEELLGRHIREITHPDDYGAGAQYRSQLTHRTMKTAIGEKRFVRKDGTPLWARRTMSTACDTEGRPLYVISVVEDISERKQLEREFQDTFDQAAMGIAHTSIDGLYLRVNQKLCEMVGYSEAELIGRRGTDLMHPDDRGTGETRRLMWEGKLSRVSEEKRYFRKDGSMIWMNRAISLARDGSGKPQYFIRIFEDITERKQIETEHAQLAAIVETSNDAIISRGLDRTILTWNPAAEILFGWTAQEAVGRSILLIVPPERHNENAHRRELVHQGLPVPAYDTQRLTRDGRRIDVALSQSAIRNKRGEVIAISLVFHDITQRRELERRFELMFSHAAVGMSLGSLDGRFLQVNRKYADMLGYSREELAGMPLASVVHPEDRAEGELLRQKLLDEGVEGISAERRYIRKDGGTIWVSRTLSLARDAAGEPLYYISVVEDITERRELERRFELTFNQAAVGILHTGLNGRYLRVNRKLCDITGYTEEELTGDPHSVLSHPDDIESGGAERKRLMAGEIASHSNEKRYVRKDGSVIWVNRTESLARDDAGGPLYFIRVIEDITARKEMEQQFRDTFEQAAVGIVHVDFDNRYIRVNRKFHEITGYAEGDLIGRSSSTISHPEDVGSGDRERRRLHAGEIPSYSNEKRYLHKKNGAAIWVKRTESIARDGTGNPLYYIRVVEDITERKEMERRFELTFNHAAVGMTQTGLDYRFLQVNRKFEEMLGYSREELAGLTAMDITHPDDRAETLSSREKLLKGEIESASSEKRLIRKDGRVIWANRTFSIARGATGEPICFITVVEDITERKDFERRYRETFDQAAVGIVHTSADGSYLRVNQKFCDMLGYDEAELVGRVAADFTYPEDRDKGAENRRLLWEGRLDHLVEERRYLRKDGRVVWTNRTVSLARDAAGAPMYFIRVIENITDRKEAEERYRATFDNAPVGIMHTALDNYRILRANHKLCEMLGYAQEELLEKTSTDIVHPDFRFSDRSSYMDQLLEGKVQSFASERVFVRKDGTPLWVNRTVSLVRDASGNPQYFIRVIEDISERKRAEAALRESEEQFRQLANNIPQVFWITDVGHRETIYISPAAALLTGRPVQQLCASPREMIRAAHPEDRRRVYEARKAAAAGGYDQTYRVVRPDGTTRWVNDRAFAVTDEAGNVYRIAGITEDVTDRKLAEERLTQLAHYDVLTDLPNRVLFYDRLRQVLAQAKRSQWIVGVMFVDLDRFKNVNDTLGHAVGDLLLRQVSERLSRAVRSGDTVGRLGGDEFAIVLSNLSSAQDASLVAQKLMASFNEPFKLQGADFYVTASIGITLYPDDAGEQDTLIKNADAAMYRAKEIGRNTYQFYRSEMNARALELLSMESHMRRALDRDEFLLHYQPKASLRDGTIVGVEALLRWQHPERGLMAPAAFMSVLEETGLIVRVGERVLNAVCRQIKAWQGAGIKVVPVAINLSAREFAAKDLAGTITRILREHDVDPALIELEITEGSLMVNTEEVVGTLEALGRLGIGLSIDDFGTGYSSLSYLKRFSLDAVKIDRSFVKDITTDADDATITRAVISMAHSLGLRVIAEGVETESQLAFLAQHGCDEIQGYYFAHPLAAEECGNWLREQRRLGQPGAAPPRNLVVMR